MVRPPRPDPVRPPRRLAPRSRRVALRALRLAAGLVTAGALAFGPASSLNGQAVPPPDPVPDTLDGVAYRVLPGRHANIHFAPEDSLVAGRVSQLLEGQPPLPALPDSLPTGVEAVLAHTPRAFDQATGGVVPEWRAGVAIPSLNMIVMPTGEGVRVVDGEGLRTLRHEWAHLGLHQYLGDLRVPRWFNEGYAQWASGRRPMRGPAHRR